MDIYSQYTLNLVGAINGVFDEESEHFLGELDEIDATQFFTAILSATTYVFNELTGEDKNLIEMTHVLNSLAVQSVVTKAKSGEDSAK